MGQHWLLVCAVALAVDVAPEYEELARRRLSKVGVVFLEDDDAVNLQCIDEIYKYSLCLQTSACAASGAKPDRRATTARCEGAPTDAAITQLVEERVRATGDDEATARAYLTSYDLCAKWGDEETKQPDRSRRTRANCPAGCDYVTNCQYLPVWKAKVDRHAIGATFAPHRYASEVWDPVYNWTDRDSGVTTLYNRTGEVLASA